MSCFLGLISGTSMDGVDAALLEIDAGGTMRLQLGRDEAYPPALRERIERAICRPDEVGLDELGELDRAVGEFFASVATSTLAAAAVPADAVEAIGSHGQTLRHRPDAAAPFTLQVGDPAVIAERTGITTVADFRRADLAAGGQGAPLMPAFHAAAFASPNEERAVINIGGIANLTRLAASGTITGFDTGPGNTLLDGWMHRETGAPYDENGRSARSGRVSALLLERLLGDPYFARLPPKSTGRELFHLEWLDAALAALVKRPTAADVAATLTELTAVTIARAIEAHAVAAARIIVCGGGVRNAYLLERLCRALAPRPVASSADFGLAPDWVEAAGFAWLAAERLAGRAAGIPAVTGARCAAILGAIHAPARRTSPQVS